MARTMAAILKEVAEVKESRQHLFRELLGSGREVHDGAPHEVRLRTLKAQNAPAMLELDARLEELRAEQREHPDHAEQVAAWAKEA